MRVTKKLARVAIAGFVILPAACAEPLDPAQTRELPRSASAARNPNNGDNTKPTAPSNLHATSVGAYSVSLAWNPSTDNSGAFSYRIRNNLGYEFTVPQSQTSYVWDYRLSPQTTFTFSVYAVDAAGNKSASSSVTVTTTANDNPPTAPVITVADVGPRMIALRWSSTDDSPWYIWYSVLVDGGPDPYGGSTTETGRTYYGFAPQTTHTFTVRARDNGGNWSAPSTITVTTESVDPNDKQAPTVPANLWAAGYGDLEFLVMWSASTDNVDTQAEIFYEIYVNGQLSDVQVGRTQSTNYGVMGANTIEVIAIDNAGNRSAAAKTTLMLP